jgi:signal transduction histidine kinase/CheY-like chemotaxis protein
MGVDPQTIRTEAHTEVGVLLQRDAGVIIDRWSRRAAEDQPNARRVHHEALLDHLTHLLQTLGRTLANSGNHDLFAHCHPAHQHGEQRWEVGWSLPELVRDYQILRLVILGYLEETLERPLSYREIMAIGLALDEAISASVTRYVTQREESLRQLQEERVKEARAVEEGLRRQAEALREADSRKNEFLATLAHELRNPLAPLRNGLGVLRLHPITDPIVVQVRDLFERQVQQLSRLVDDLLDVSRIAQGKIELRKQHVNLASMVGQAQQMSDAVLKARRHLVDVALPAEQLWVEGDPARLVQIIVNLLNNAAKYTNPGGRVGVSAERQGSEVVIKVQDNGVGIAPEMLRHVFDLFTQAEWPVDRSEGGLGIGLTLVKRLVELHGGRISAHSAGLGRGSEFVVRLPLCPAGALEAAPSLDRPAPAPVSRHILVIEDNADGRESLETLLKLLGHRVEVAEDGRKGLELALATRPDVALIDIGLPGLDGFQVAEQIRAALGPGILLVALTGYGQPEDRRQALEAGFNAHLVKPVELDGLQRLLVTAEAS